MKYINVLISVLFLYGVEAYSQNDYFSTDSIKSVGVKLVNGGSIDNSSFCQVKTGDSVFKYSPDLVKEYGFSGGRVYISKPIMCSDSVRNVFMERLVKGKTSLFFYKGRDFSSFYLQKDSSALISLPKSLSTRNDYNSRLTDLTSECQKVADASKLVAYRKKSMSEFISRYNRCESMPFPVIRYGLFVGMIQSGIILKRSISDEFMNKFTFRADKSLYYGLFMDVPIQATDFSAYIGLGFYQSSFSSNYSSVAEESDILIQQSTIKIPVLLTYTLPSIKFRPYINLGINYSNNIRNNCTIYNAVITDNTVQFESPIKDHLFPNNQLGYAAGLGVKFHQSYRRIIFVEIRYNMDFPVDHTFMLKKSAVEFIGGINF